MTLFAYGVFGTRGFAFVDEIFCKLIPDAALELLVVTGILLLYSWLLLRLSGMPGHAKIALAAGIYANQILDAIFAGLLIPAAIAAVVLITSWIKSKGKRSPRLAECERYSFPLIGDQLVAPPFPPGQAR